MKYFQTRLERQVEFLEHNKDIGILGTGVHIFNSEDDETSSDDTSTEKRLIFHPTNPGFVSWTLMFYCCLVHPSVMMRREVFDIVGLYSPDVHHVEDYDLWLRAMEAGVKLANLPDVLLKLRKHKSSVSSTHCEMQKQNAAEVVTSSINRFTGRSLPDVRLDQVTMMRDESTVNAAEELEPLFDLIELLENYFCAAGGIDGIDSKLIHRDALSRLGAMAVIGMGNFAFDAIGVYNRWSKLDKIRSRDLLLKLV